MLGDFGDALFGVLLYVVRGLEPVFEGDASFDL
jgi:hypothetical protein